jgi:ABC-type uncharacterized transport system permease subunit
MLLSFMPLSFMPLSVSAPLRFGPFPFMPLSGLMEMANYAGFLYASFRRPFFSAGYFPLLTTFLWRLGRQGLDNF